jgi:hypothetical protein
MSLSEPEEDLPPNEQPVSYDGMEYSPPSAPADFGYGKINPDDPSITDDPGIAPVIAAFDGIVSAGGSPNAIISRLRELIVGVAKEKVHGVT